MPNYYTGTSNYEAFKAGRGLKDGDIYFIVHEDYNTFWDNAEQWCKFVYKHSRFLGTKAECDKNIDKYPDHKIV